ncbi:WD40 repeat-like protein, partial [Wolfiporia cocos MD-104 SS10]
MDTDEDTRIPLAWTRSSTDSSPFILARVHRPQEPNAHPFHCTAVFPWSEDSIADLWDGAVTDEEIISQWQRTVRKHKGAVAVGSTGKSFLFPKLCGGRPYMLKLPEPSWEVHCVAWALSSTAPIKPLLVVAASSILVIFDVETRQIVGQLRGHGGPITSIAVHPVHPYLLCTTARDFTTRIYDLTLRPAQMPNNPHWLPSTRRSLASPAFGLQSTESEGQGIGRCVAVLVGGRSGGHRGAVFAAAFHRTEPLIATAGMDRAVKIWRIPPYDGISMAREDKPFFSTNLIHKARVLSIAWLSHDILISHSAPALMYRGDMKGFYEESGTVAVWQWLALNRFFPPGRPAGAPTPKVMRGCVTDYTQSELFKVIAEYHLPPGNPKAATSISLRQAHDPLLLVPAGRAVRVFSIARFAVRDRPPFPPDENAVVAALATRLRDANLGGDDDDDGDREDGEYAARGSENLYGEDDEQDAEEDEDEDEDEEMPPPA